MDKLTHINEEGRPKMVDVGNKEDTLRIGEAYGCIYMEEKTLEMITGGKHKKGDVIATAQVAGIMGAKNMGDNPNVPQHPNERNRHEIRA